MRISYLAGWVLTVYLSSFSTAALAAEDDDQRTMAAKNHEDTRYSALESIHHGNVGQLKVGLSRRYMLELPGGSDPIPSVCAAPASGQWFGERGGKWILGNYGNTLYNHFHQPNSPLWEWMNMQQQKASSGARSFHPGGVSVLL